MLDTDLPIDLTAPSTEYVKEAVAKLRDGKAAGVCNINAELLIAGGGRGVNTAQCTKLRCLPFASGGNLQSPAEIPETWIV